MPKKLVIVESPGKVKTIQKYLGPQYIVKASVGHCYEIDKKDGAIDVDNNYEPKYVVSTKKRNVVKQLQALAKTVDEVYIASDPDREGEAIGWHIAHRALKCPKKIRRIVFHEITKSAVLSALSSPGDLNEDLYHAQQARAVLDRLVGYKVSPILWRKVCKGTSAGRVQSIGLRLIVERHREITAFVPEEYWTIDGLFNSADRERFHAAYVPDGKVKTEIQAMTIKKEVEAHEGKWDILGVDKKEKKRSPYPIFNTSSLQQFCSSYFGWDGKKTMKIAQDLYEGFSIKGQESTGLCLHPDEQVVLENGAIISITSKDLRGSCVAAMAPINEGLWTAPLESKHAHVEATQRKEFSGDLVNIRTLDGQEISATPDHLFLCYAKGNLTWVPAGMLEEGMHVVTSRKIPTKRNYAPSSIAALVKELPLDVRKNISREGSFFKWTRSNNSSRESYDVEWFYYFLGLVLGDGHISKSSKITFTMKIMTQRQWSSLYMKLTRKKRTFTSPYLANFNGMVLKNLCIHFGGREGKKSSDIFIHPTISKSKPKLLGRFIGGLFDSDGCINVSKNKRVSVLYSTKSVKFARQLVVLLRTLSFEASLHRRNDDRENCSIKLTGHENQKRFLKWLKKFSYIKKSQIDNALRVLEKQHSSNNKKRDNLPVFDLIERERLAKGLTKQQVSLAVFGDSSSYWNYRPKKGHRISRSVLKKIAACLGSDTLKVVAESDVILSTVKTSSRTPYSGMVYDITTSTSNFIANTFVSHNCTYHRTDSTSISSDALGAVRPIIASMGNAYLPAKPRFYKTKAKSAQEAHEGIRPTHMEYTPADVKASVPSDHARLYEAIYKRFVSCQMTDAVFDTMKVSINADGTKHNFQANGQKLKFDGFLKVWTYSKSNDAILPDLKKDDKVSLLEAEATQHFTKPPAAFNTASLVKTLEEKGIGRPSTYASIVDTLLKRQYVEKDGKAFKATELGMLVSDFLVEAFPELMDTGYTARIEEQLDEIADSKRVWYESVDAFYKELRKRIEASKTIKSSKTAEETNITCPVCKKNKLVKRRGKYGSFYGCAGYTNKGKDKCKATFEIGEDGQPIKKEKRYLEGVTCDKCGGKIVIRTSKKKGSEFGGCENFPRCRRMFSMDGMPIEPKSRYRK